MEIDAENGIYSFNTSNNVRYICRFREANFILSPLLRVYDIEAFDFDFYPESNPDRKTKFDQAISLTICRIIELFFTSNLRVLLFVCDSLDGRHRERHCLFNRWYRLYSNDQIIGMTFNVAINDDSIYGSVFVRSDFSHLHIFEAEFQKAVTELINEK